MANVEDYPEEEIYYYLRRQSFVIQPQHFSGKSKRPGVWTQGRLVDFTINVYVFTFGKEISEFADLRADVIDTVETVLENYTSNYTLQIGDESDIVDSDESLGLGIYRIMYLADSQPQYRAWYRSRHERDNAASHIVSKVEKFCEDKLRGSRFAWLAREIIDRFASIVFKKKRKKKRKAKAEGSMRR